MTPRISTIGASIRKMFSGIGGDGDPYWDNVVLALHMDGVNAGVSFPDLKGKIVTVAGNVNTSTAQKKFGTASAYFDGVGDYLELAMSADFNYGTGDFTVECWVYPVARTDTYPIVWASYLNTVADIGLMVMNNGSGQLLYDGTYSNFAASSVPNNVWTHLAVERYGTELALYVNGVKIVSVTRGTTLGRSTAPFYIGNLNNSSTQHRYKGYIDDFRMTKGVSRYKGNFTPPLQPFPEN